MMKKLFTLALCLCLTLCLAAPALAEEATIYLALGDSITTGYGLDMEAGDKGFADILAENNNYTLNNLAVNGNTAVGLLTQLTDAEVLAQIAAADVITLTCGGNDMMALLYSQVADAYNATLAEGADPIDPANILTLMSDPTNPQIASLLMIVQSVLNGNAAAGTPAFADTDIFTAGLDAYVAALNTVVKGIYAVNPDVTLIVATQYNPYKSFIGLYAALNTGIDAGAQKLNQVIVDNAAVAGYQVADVYTAFQASEANLSNAAMSAPMNLDFHPNADGHAVIAECFQGVLDQAE